MVVAPPSLLHAQRGAGPAAPPPSPRAAAPIDLTGYWESFVTEDWRWRMVTPPKGSYQSVTLNAEARKIADAWDPASDEAAGNQCKAYGAAAVMRVPGRLHITWDNDTTLKIETEAGTQTRLLHFGTSEPPAGEPTWQGHTVATWQSRRFFPAPGRTRRARPGGHDPEGRDDTPARRLSAQERRSVQRKRRRDGVLQRASEPNGDTWLIVTNTVDDPQFLTQPFVTSSHFKKLADGSAWKPVACTAR